MKETVNVNLASQAFTFDKDAYRSMKVYLAAIRSRLPQGDEETLSDVEARLAEILRSKLSSPMMVVTLTMVQEAKAQMGDPSEFGEGREPNPASPGDEGEESAGQTPARRLYRSRTDRSIAGVCGGLAEYLEVDVTALRLVTLLLILFGGLSIWVYVILWILIPSEPMERVYAKRKNKEL